MLAEYVMNNIDSMFLDRLNKNKSSNVVPQVKNNNKIFNKDTIKKLLHEIIRKNNNDE
jgi:hypothetical protein